MPKLNVGQTNANVIKAFKVALTTAYIITDIDNDLGAKVNAAIAENNVVIVPEGSYTLEQPIVLSGLDYKTLIILGNITYSGSGSAIEITNCRFSKIFVHEIYALNGTCIKIQGNNGLCQLNEIHSVNLYGSICIDISASGSGAVQHTAFYSNYIHASTKAISITSTGASAWCGELKFFGGEVNGANAIGVYSNGYCTAIRAFGLGFESLATCLDLHGNNQELTFLGCRAEQSGSFILSDVVRNFIFEGATLKPKSGVITTGLTGASGIVFRGLMYSAGGNMMGTEYQIGPNLVGFISAGRMALNKEFYYINNQNGGEIGGALTDGICPTIARIVSTGTFTLSPAYSLCGVKQLIIYAEKAGIVIKNSDASKTLFTTTAAQSVWRITSADRNSYFSPSGFIVENITPVL